MDDIHLLHWSKLTDIGFFRWYKTQSYILQLQVSVLESWIMTSEIEILW